MICPHCIAAAIVGVVSAIPFLPYLIRKVKGFLPWMLKIGSPSCKKFLK